MLLHVRFDFYGQHVVDADAKVVLPIEVFPTELNYLCATFCDHRGYGKLGRFKILRNTFLFDLVIDDDLVSINV